MSKELTIVDPSEFGINESDANNLKKGLQETLAEREVLRDSYLQVIDLEITEENLKTFKELRLKFVKNRTQGLDKWKKSQKAYFLAGGNFVQAIYNKEVKVNEEIESKLQEAEKHFENLEKERIQKLNAERVELVRPYLDEVDNLYLADMEEDVFEAYLSTKRNNYEAIKEAEAKEEAERLAKIEAEKKEQERIRLENIELKKKAEEAEKKAKAEQLERERLAKIEADKRAKEEAEKQKAIDAERKKQAEILAKEKAKQDKLKAELKAKEEAEAKAKKIEAERLEAERLEAEKLAKAPIKEKMKVWLNGLTVGTPPELNDTTTDIINKFESFINWAKKEVEKM